MAADAATSDVLRRKREREKPTIPSAQRRFDPVAGALPSPEKKTERKTKRRNRQSKDRRREEEE